MPSNNKKSVGCWCILDALSMEQIFQMTCYTLHISNSPDYINAIEVVSDFSVSINFH